jgi:DNA-binding FadR family transcriptional regulator
MAVGFLEPSPQAETREIVRDLIRQVQSDGLTIGERLPSIRQLAEKFQVSASVIRDALMQVQAMGLVKIQPRSGAYVQSVNYAPLVNVLAETLEGAVMQVDENLFHLIEARLVLEVECVGQAAQRRRLEDLLPLRGLLDKMDDTSNSKSRADFMEFDIMFHLRIAQLAGNPVLLTMLRTLLGSLRPHLVQLPWGAKHRSTTCHSHAAIYEALVAGDVDQARASMRAHLKLALDSLLARVQSVPGHRADGSAEKSESETGQLS